MICKLCGTEVSEDDQLCPYCGRALCDYDMPSTKVVVITTTNQEARKKISHLQQRIKDAEKDKSRAIIDICFQLFLVLFFRLDIFDYSPFDLLACSNDIEFAIKSVLGWIHDNHIIIAIIAFIIICFEINAISKASETIKECCNEIELLNQAPSSEGKSWKCTCGRINADYTSSCVCGKHKKDVKAANSNKQI